MDSIYLEPPTINEILNQITSLKNKAVGLGAPRTKRGPWASSNITHLQFCELQDRRGKCHKFFLDFDLLSKKQKKGLQGKMSQLSQEFDVIFEKKKKKKKEKVFGLPHLHFSVPF